MGSKAIHQLPLTTTYDPTDRLYVARPSGGSYVDRSVARSSVFPELFTSTVTITSAQVLALNTTPQIIVDAPAATETIVPWYWIYEITGVSAAYAANVTMSIGLLAMTAGNRLSEVLINQNTDRMIYIRPTAQGYINSGAALYAKVLTGNPTTGTGDITITTYYTLA